MEIIQQAGTILKLFFQILPWILSIAGLHQILYTKSPKYYFTIMKFLSKRKDTKWETTVSFRISQSDDFFGVFQYILNQRFNGFQRKFNLRNKKHYSFGNFACTVLYNIEFEETDQISVELLFDPLNVTLKNSEERLKELRHLFTDLEKGLQVYNKSYNMNIEFTSMNNPFYGLMIQRLGPEHIDYFECVFPISMMMKKQRNKDTQNNYKLRIFKDKITVTESNYDILEEIVLDSLLLR
ncbi:hypothetical protein GCM10028778_25480 [Barrientosiimonas marina]